MLHQLIKGETLSYYEAKQLMNDLLHCESEAVKAAYLTHYAYRQPTNDELAGFYAALSDVMNVVPYEAASLIDTCGTGGDGSRTFNISTASAIVAASGGAIVAKHGNRAMSSASGSADVFQQLGISFAERADEAVQQLTEQRLAFLFAPAFHPLLKAVGPVRQQLKVRTIFNMLGPILNPTKTKRQLIGVYSPQVAEQLAELFQSFGDRHVLIVHGHDGLDEATITTETTVHEVKGTKCDVYTIAPEDVGLVRGQASRLTVGSAFESKERIIAIMDGSANRESRHIVAFNSGLALYVAGQAKTIEAGVAQALELMADGRSEQFLAGLTKGERAYVN